MSGVANPARGEAMIAGCKLRPSFTALVAAEAELGPLFELVERAASGKLGLAEMVGLFWHCVEDRDGMTPEDFGARVAEAGLATATPALRMLLGQILGGR